MISFVGQVAVVTGAGRGLGRLFALELARRGAKVVVNDLGGSMGGDGADASVADAVVREILALGGDALASHDSVATQHGAQAIVDAAVARFGRVDAVVSNAGIFNSIAFEDLTSEDWRRMLSVHLDGGFYLSQAAFRVMKRQGYGRLVFMSSSAGVFGQPMEAHYAAAKMGLVGLANVVALEGAAHNVFANTVLPFGFSRMVRETVGAEGESHPFLQAIDPELVVPMVVFLASRECSVTHQNYSACAGRFARVFVGLAEGWLADGRPSADQLAERFATVSATKPFSIPESIFDEVGEVSARVGAVSTGEAGASERYSVDTLMAQLLDDPQAKALLATFLPEIHTAGPMLKLARGMTLRKISGYPQARISPEKLTTIDAALAALPPASATPRAARTWWRRLIHGVVPLTLFACVSDFSPDPYKGNQNTITLGDGAVVSERALVEGHVAALGSSLRGPRSASARYASALLIPRPRRRSRPTAARSPRARKRSSSTSTGPRTGSCTGPGSPTRSASRLARTAQSGAGLNLVEFARLAADQATGSDDAICDATRTLVPTLNPPRTSSGPPPRCLPGPGDSLLVTPRTLAQCKRAGERATVSVE